MTRSEAARTNGAKSKGPVSVEGKAASSRNSLKHGHYAKSFFLLDGEDDTEYARTRADYFHIYRPRTAEEADLVIDIVNSRWLIRRAQEHLAALADFELYTFHHVHPAAYEGLSMGQAQAIAGENLVEKKNAVILMYNRMEATARRTIHKTMKLLQDLRKLPAPPVITPYEAYIAAFLPIGSVESTNEPDDEQSVPPAQPQAAAPVKPETPVPQTRTTPQPQESRNEPVIPANLPAANLANSNQQRPGGLANRPERTR